MAMVTEMRIPGGEHGVRFNYRGLHRYLVTFLRARHERSLAEKPIVLTLIPALHDACREHRFDVYAYTFLPERLVLIIRGRDEASDMRAWVRTFRTAADAAAGAEFGVPVFARRYTERVLRKTEVSREIAEGVFRMAVTAGLANDSGEYEFQGSFVLAGSPEREGRRDEPRRSSGGAPRTGRPAWKDRRQGQRPDQRKDFRGDRPGAGRNDQRKDFRTGRPGGQRPDQRKDFRGDRPGAGRNDQRKDFRTGRPGDRRTDQRKDFRRDQSGDRRTDRRKGFGKGPRKRPGGKRT
jgi:hypothetical protein